MAQAGSATDLLRFDGTSIEAGQPAGTSSRPALTPDVRRIAIVALARELPVPLWRYAKQGLVPDGAALKAA